jgi:hypothetical protein
MEIYQKTSKREGNDKKEKFNPKPNLLLVYIPIDSKRVLREELKND